MYERNMRYLNTRRVIYRSYPTQTPTEEFEWGRYYVDGTYECYELFRSKAKINTYKSLKWHLLVLWYLNPSMDQDEFLKIAEHITYKENGFTTFNTPTQLLKTIVYEVSMCDLDKPPKNKIRKIIFWDFCGLEVSEKLKIVGQLSGRSKKVHEDDIYQSMLDLHDCGKKITIGRLAELLNCSYRTIHRNMPEELKREKELLNREL